MVSLARGTRCVVLGCVAVVLAAGAGRGQEARLAPGARVRVFDAAGAWVTGTLARATGDSLWLQLERDSAHAIALGPMAHLERSLGTRSRAGTGALIGAVVGAAVTAGFLAGFCGGDTLCDGDEQVRAALLLGAPSLVIGTVVGALIRTERWERVPLPIVVGAKRGGPWRAGVALGP